MGDGETIRFWEDASVGDLGPLKLLAYADIPEPDLHRKLHDFADAEGSWDWHRFTHLLPPDTLALIALSTPPRRQGPCDSCHWTLTANGSFSVASAYNALRDEVWGEKPKHWQWIWKWPGLQQIRVFLWLTLHGRLLTNSERQRRGMASDATCGRCQAPIEDLDHIFRHCPFAQACGAQIIPSHHLPAFYLTPFDEWLLGNLDPQGHGTSWRTFFGTMLMETLEQQK